MPIVRTFMGSVTIKAVTLADDKPLYDYAENAYGETIGELLDNLVELSVKAANEAFLWAVDNKPADYAPYQDRWTVNFIHPDIFDAQLYASNRTCFDVASSSTVKKFGDIVDHCVLSRNTSISVTKNNLHCMQGGGTDIPHRASVPYTGLYDETTSFRDMTNFGWTGKELAQMLETAQREGRLEKYSDRLMVERSFRANSRPKAQKSDATPSKKKWWQGAF